MTFHSLSIGGLLLPLILPVVAAGLILLLAETPPQNDSLPSAGSTTGGRHLLFLALAALGTSTWLLLALPRPEGAPLRALSQALVYDGLASVAAPSICVIAMLCVLLGFASMTLRLQASAEFLALLLFATTGALCVALSGDLLAMFLGIELMSMASYVLAGYRRSSRRAQEAALKYYLYGAFASAFMIFGMALVWGECGRVLGEPTFSFVGIGFAIGTGSLEPLGYVGVGLLLCGLLFKVGAVPFHMWVPDVYQGAPTPSTAFFAAVVKLASFVGLARVAMATLLVTPAATQAAQWLVPADALATVAIVSIFVGNVLAIRQVHVKRLLAFSSVAHAGYALLGLVAVLSGRVEDGLVALCYYLISYGAIVLGAFAVVCAFEGSSEERRQELTLDRLAGAGRSHPLLGMVAITSLFALAGIPPTAGFFGKLSLLTACVRGGYLGTATWAAIGSAIGAYAYLKVISTLFMRARPFEMGALRSPWLNGALLSCMGVALAMGLFPEPFWAWAQSAMHGMVP